MAGTVENVTDENYEEFKGAQATVVAYGIAACEPCAAYDPILAEVARKLPNRSRRKSQDARAGPVPGNQKTAPV